jgi:hypothetical protein
MTSSATVSAVCVVQVNRSYVAGKLKLKPQRLLLLICLHRFCSTCKAWYHPAWVAAVLCTRRSQQYKKYKKYKQCKQPAQQQLKQ